MKLRPVPVLRYCLAVAAPASEHGADLQLFMRARHGLIHRRAYVFLTNLVQQC